MKLFNYLLAGILCASVTCLPAQHRADPQKLVNPESFSMILLGDPQGYTKYDINQPLFDLCTAWIADNIESLKIKAVLCTGDLVEQNDNNVLNRKMLNQTSREMWEAASQALKRLDNKVPYIIAAGNHDYGYKAAENGRTYFPDYIPFERNSNLIQKTHEETTTLLLLGCIGTDSNSSAKLQRVERSGSEFRKPLRYAH